MPGSGARAVRWSRARGAVAAGIVAFAGVAAGQNALYGWGFNTFGQAFIGGTSPNTVVGPLQAGTTTGWSALAASFEHALAIRDGRLYAVGSNQYGVTGLGTEVGGSATPTQVGVATDWTAVDTSTRVALGIRDGRLYAWGTTSVGAMGRGSAADASTVPVQVGSDVGWTAVSIREGHVLAIRDGRLYAWGSNLDGKTGLGVTAGTTNAPAQIGDDVGWTHVAAGGSFSLAIRDGALYAWGRAEYTGLDEPGGTVDEPTRVGSDADWTAIAASGLHALGMRGGQVYAWGSNAFGATGLGTAAGTTLAPQRVGDLDDWTAVAAGDRYSLGLRQGRLYGWGYNLYGRAGLPGPADGDDIRTVPTPSGTFDDWVLIDAGDWTGLGARFVPPSLSLVVTASDTAPAPGQVVTVVLTLTNGGPLAVSITVPDVLAAGRAVADPASVFASQGVFDGATWVVRDLASGATATLTFEATVDGEVSP